MRQGHRRERRIRIAYVRFNRFIRNLRLAAGRSPGPSSVARTAPRSAWTTCRLTGLAGLPVPYLGDIRAVSLFTSTVATGRRTPNRKEVRHTHQVGCTARSSAGARGALPALPQTSRRHRRGGAAVHEARRDDIATEHLATAMNELRTQATAITEQLVVVSRLPSAKRQNGFRTLRSQVDEVERLAARIALAGR